MAKRSDPYEPCERKRETDLSEHCATLPAGSTDTKDMMRLVGYDMARAAANKVYEESGIGPEEIGVVELHDCFAHNELITYEALGLCPEGGAQEFIDAGDNTYGGKVVTNPSGGLLSKGHPLGRDRPCAMLRTDQAAAGNRRGEPG